MKTLKESGSEREIEFIETLSVPIINDLDKLPFPDFIEKDEYYIVRLPYLILMNMREDIGYFLPDGVSSTVAIAITQY